MKKLIITGLLFLLISVGTQAGSYEDTMAAINKSHQDHMQFMNNMIQQSRNREMQYQRQNQQQYNQMMQNYSRMMQPYGRAGSSAMYPGATNNQRYSAPSTYPGFSGSYPDFASGVGNAIGSSVRQGIPQGTIPGAQQQSGGLPSMNMMGIEAPTTDHLYVRDPWK